MLSIATTTCDLSFSEDYPVLNGRKIENCQDLILIASEMGFEKDQICSALWEESFFCDNITKGRVRHTCQRSCGICDQGSTFSNIMNRPHRGGGNSALFWIFKDCLIFNLLF